MENDDWRVKDIREVDEDLIASDYEEKNRLLEQAAAREQSLKDQLNLKALQLQTLKESLLTKSNELGKPPAALESPKTRSLTTTRGRTNSMSDVPISTSISAKDAREFHTQATNLEKIEREIGEKAKTLALLNKQLFRRSGSYSPPVGTAESVEGMQTSASLPEDALATFSSSSPRYSYSPSQSPPRSPSPAFRGVGSIATDAVFAELQEVRALRDKLQSQLVRRREDNEVLQQQLINAQGELSKKQAESDGLRQQLNEAHTQGRALQQLFIQAKQEFDEKSVTMTQVLEEMRRSQVELQGAQLHLAGPISEKFEELQVQLFNAQSMNADLQLRMSRLNSELDQSQLTIHSLESKVISLENAKSDLERKSILVVADSKQFSVQLEEAKRHHESELDRMHVELQKMINEVTEERKARKKAEQLQQEAEDEVNAYRKEREARLRMESNEEPKEEESPFAYLLQKARDKSSALEDSVSSLQSQIHTLQNESQNLRTEIAVLRTESDKSSKAESATKTRQRKAKVSETESRIMEVEMRLKRQLSLSELGNLAQMAETELINSRLSSKIGELEYALRHANDAAARAQARAEEAESKMTLLASTGGQLQEAGERMQSVQGEDLERTLKERIRYLEADVVGHAKEKQAMEAKIVQLQEDLGNFGKMETERRVEFERQRETLTRETNLLRERIELEKKNYEEYTVKMDGMLEEEKKTKQTIVENFANKLQDDLKVAEDNLTFTQHLAERVSAYEADQNKLQLKSDELNAAKTELENTKQKLSSATDRIRDLEGELDMARTELLSVKSGLDVGRMELKGVRRELASVREENARLQELNTVVVTKLGEKDNELTAKTNEILNFSATHGDLTNLKTELGNLQAEVLALKSIVDSKQELIESLENERKERLAAYEELEKAKQEALSKYSLAQSELVVKLQAIDALNKLKMELENELALERKIVEDIKIQNSLLASQMESKEGDFGGLVAQVGKLSEELHAQEKACSDLRTEVQSENAGRREAESQNKHLVEKLREMEVASTRLNTELTQQLAHLRAESEHKSKTITNLETNMANVSSHLSQTRLQLDELAKTSSEKSETIAHLRVQVSSIELQQKKDQLDLQELAKLSQDRADSIAELGADLARRSAELHAIEKSLSEKSDYVLDLERKLADSQRELESVKQAVTHSADQLEQRTSELNDQKTKIREMALAHEEEHLQAQRISGELREKLASIEVQLASISNELENEKRERVVDAERHKVTVNSLVIMLEDIFKRLKWETEDPLQPTQQDMPDLAAYWSHPPHREVLTDMEVRKASIDHAIQQIKASTVCKTEMDARLQDVAALLESEKLARAKLEAEKTEVLADLDKRTALLKALELEEEARTVLVQQMEQQIAHSKGEEGLAVIVSCLETSLINKAVNPALTQAFRNVLHFSQLRSKDNSDLRVELASTKDILRGKFEELERANVALIDKERQLAEKTRELVASHGACAELEAQVRSATQQYQSAQRGIEEHAREELRVLTDALNEAKRERIQLEEEHNRKLEDKTRQLIASQCAREELAVQMRSATQQYHNAQERAREELHTLQGALTKVSLEKTQLKEDYDRLGREKAKLEADYKRALGRLEQMLEERRQLLGLWGIKGDGQGVNVVGTFKEGKERLENELQFQRAQRLDLESEAARLYSEMELLRADLGEAEAEKTNALERLAKADISVPYAAAARKGPMRVNTQSTTPGVALASAVPQQASPLKRTSTLLPPFAVGPMRMIPPIALDAGVAALGAGAPQAIPTAAFSIGPTGAMPPVALGAAPIALGAGVAQNKRTLALGSLGLGHVLKGFLTEHSAIPDDLELVDAEPLNTSIESILARSRTLSNSSRSSRSSSVVDEEEEKEKDQDSTT
eukprot:Phypoly_transcript_00157.p1 GENE.Phypoly_transcript_00157~~Phypoly_transcript_00157.p1  ORF type:complete len:2031 (+),score=467.97 Phypoly_transcript_00157:440-6094(+)